MLFKERFWAGLEDGSLTVAYRRWKRPTVRAGGTLVSPGGLLAIDSVETVDPDEVDEAAAKAAGYHSRAELFANIRGDLPLHRITFHRLGDDPRIALRRRTDLTAAEAAKVKRFLERNDWAVRYLQLIADMPGVVSTVLAGQVGEERFVFKQQVRKLKALGLTESLEVGYRISPRGRALLDSHPPVPGSNEGLGGSEL